MPYLHLYLKDAYLGHCPTPFYCTSTFGGIWLWMFNSSLGGLPLFLVLHVPHESKPWKFSTQKSSRSVKLLPFCLACLSCTSHVFILFCGTWTLHATSKHRLTVFIGSTHFCSGVLIPKRSCRISASLGLLSVQICVFQTAVHANDQVTRLPPTLNLHDKTNDRQKLICFQYSNIQLFSSFVFLPRWRNKCSTDTSDIPSVLRYVLSCLTNFITEYVLWMQKELFDSKRNWLKWQV